MVNLANNENNRIMKENNYIESAQLSKSIVPQITEKIIRFTQILENHCSNYIQLKYKQELNSFQKSVLKNKINHLSEEYDHSIKHKQINEDLVQERTILRARIITQNKELDLAKSNNLLLKQNIQSIILNFSQIRNIQVEYKSTPDGILRMEIGDLREQCEIIGEENRKLLSEIKDIRNHMKSQILDKQLQHKGLINMHTQEEYLLKSNLINMKNELSNRDEELSYQNAPNEYLSNKIEELNENILWIQGELSELYQNYGFLNDNYKLCTDMLDVRMSCCSTLELCCNS